MSNIPFIVSDDYLTPESTELTNIMIEYGYCSDTPMVGDYIATDTQLNTNAFNKPSWNVSRVIMRDGNKYRMEYDDGLTEYTFLYFQTPTVSMASGCLIYGVIL